MAAAARARPEDYFNAEEWRSLSERSTWRGLWLVAHCWGVIAIAMLSAWAAGDMTTAAFLPLVMTIGHILEERSLLGSQEAIRALSKLASTGPTTCSTTGLCSNPRTRIWCCQRRFQSAEPRLRAK